GGQGSGKLVIFTESRVTMFYLRDRRLESKWLAPGEVTLFSGVNDSKEAMAALARWRHEVPQGEGPPPSEEIAVRLALVHEFETRSRLFISTEAGAKGLNLQFCDTVVNYDLPWNPQRIEQRIGRCHRYKQKHDPVTVINFLARDNEAQRLTFQILSEKLELFGTVLDASDQVLHRSDATGKEALVGALGAGLEAELRRIYDRARTLDEVTAELQALREKVDENRRRFEETHQRTAGLIENEFDDRVKQAFRAHKSELPGALAAFDDERARARRRRSPRSKGPRVAPGERRAAASPHPSLGPRRRRRGAGRRAAAGRDHRPSPGRCRGGPETRGPSRSASPREGLA